MSDQSAAYKVERMCGMHLLFLYIHNAPKYEFVENVFLNTDVSSHRQLSLKNIFEVRCDYDILKFLGLISPEEQGHVYSHIDHHYSDGADIKHLRDGKSD